MAETANDNEQPKKARPARKAPRIDMTPMVDLAFLLLTFFVLTSNLHEPKAMEVTMPGDGPPMEVDNDLAQTILINGDDQGDVFCYSGKFDPDKGYTTLHFNDNSLREFIATANADIQTKYTYVNTAYTSGRFTQENFDRIDQYLRMATASKETELAVVRETKAERYSEAIALMNTDLQNGTMSDATFKAVSNVLRNADNAPVFILKWGDEAKYDGVIAVIDELKIGQVSKYVVVEISDVENEELMHLNENK